MAPPHVTAIVAQALSHYSYHASQTDGCLYGSCSYVLSDVVIIKSTARRILGRLESKNGSMRTSNRLCCSSWKNWSGAKCLIQPVFSLFHHNYAGCGYTAPTVGQVFRRVWPSSIMFTQDSIKNCFKMGKPSWRQHRRLLVRISTSMIFR